jgi:drug/metabolite transporter (DMT)-like permease
MSSPRPAQRDFSAGVLPLAVMIVSVCTWGAASVLVKQITVDGLTVSFYRLWIGCAAAFLALALARHRLTFSELVQSAPAGAVFGIQMVLAFTSIKLTTVANATLIGALQPALVLLVAGSWFGERIGRWQIGWTAVSIAGIAVLIAGASSSPEWSPLGDTLAVIGVVGFTGYFLASRRIRDRLSSVAYTAGVQLSAAIVVTPVVIVHGLQPGELTGGDWVRVTAIACTSGVGAHLLVNWAHPYVRVSVSSVLILLVPVVAALSAWAVLDESLTPLQLAGGVITLGAIVALTRSGHGVEKIEEELPEAAGPAV